MNPSIHAKNALSFAVLFAATLPLGRELSTAVAVGGVLQVFNLVLLERGVGWLLGTLAPSGGGLVRALISLRFGFLFGLWAVLLIAFRLDPIGFAVGFSSVVPAMLWHGFGHARLGANA